MKKLISYLYLGLVEEKGVYIAIDTLKLIQTHHKLSHVNLYIAGDGEIRDDLVKYVKEKKISNCHILGSVYGIDKEKLFNKSHILLFPTYYGEGLPNAILEAMGSGLPVVSRINAGIPDQIEHKVNGYLTDSLEPEWYAEAIVKLLNPSVYQTISENNITKAKNYSKDAVSFRLMDIYNQLLCLK